MQTKDDRILCDECGKDCTRAHWGCDRDVDRDWCPDCFEKSECFAGRHGEGCPTSVVGDAPWAP